MQPTDRTNPTAVESAFSAPDVSVAKVSASLATLFCSPGYWLLRGWLVGLSLGASAGSIYPIIGTMIGAVLGSVAGFGIGSAVAIFALATRHWFPAAPATVQLRERIACLVVIWMPVLVFRDIAFWLAIPASLGTIHALAAGTPEMGAVYCGNVSQARQLVCKGLPLGICLVIAVGWSIVAANNGN